MHLAMQNKTALKVATCLCFLAILALMMETQFYDSEGVPNPEMARAAITPAPNTSAPKTIAPKDIAPNTSAPDSRNDDMVIYTGDSTPAGQRVGTSTRPTYAKCKFLQTTSEPWPEDAALKEPQLKDVKDAASPAYSKLRAISDVKDVRLGNLLDVEVVLYDGSQRRLNRGGDNVLVIMRDSKHGASVTGKVTDNQDGSYLAQLPVWWVGDLEIVAIITAPRQMVETAFRRRYICPQLSYDVTEFKHPTKPITESTICNTDPDIPGYSAVCNMTSQNYGSAWFCGRPRNKQLACKDWSTILIQWPPNINLTPAESQILGAFQKAKYLPGRIQVSVKAGNDNATTVQPATKCHETTPGQTWGRTAPIGFLYGRRWINSICQAPSNLNYLKSCLKNTKIILVGDSTLRQWHRVIQNTVSCQFVTDTFSGGVVKFHRPMTCYNTGMNLTMTWGPHGLPFSTPHTPHKCMKSFKAYLDEVNVSSRLIIILHAFVHYTPSHSSMFTKVIRDTVTAIEQLLLRNPHVIVAIKGPHSFVFAHKGSRILADIDKYADIYHAIIQKEFSHLTNRVFYIDFRDITRAGETTDMHAPQSIVSESVNQFFGTICKPQ